VFEYNGKVYKLTGRFAKINQENIKLSKNKLQIFHLERFTALMLKFQFRTSHGTTVLFPGGFKPPHRGHFLDVIFGILH
jgi:hypothetical protein